MIRRLRFQLRFRPRPIRSPARARAGFTLIELIVAGLLTTFVVSAVSLCLSQIGRVKNTSKLRFDAFIRADSALNSLRQEIVSVLRSDDLFYTRLLISDESVRGPDESFDRDEILIFNTRVRSLRNIEFGGEGFEYETQFRISDDEYGPVLWARHDAMPDEYPGAGGMATPNVEGILAMSIEAYTGDGSWTNLWDSDVDGLPQAVRITVLASGHRGIDDIYDAPRALLRTVVPIDRVMPPKDLTQEEEAEDENAGDETGDGADPTGDGTGDGTGGGIDNGGGGVGGPGGGGRPGGGGGRPGEGPRGGGGGRPNPGMTGGGGRP